MPRLQVAAGRGGGPTGGPDYDAEPDLDSDASSSSSSDGLQGMSDASGGREEPVFQEWLVRRRVCWNLSYNGAEHWERLTLMHSACIMC